MTTTDLEIEIIKLKERMIEMNQSISLMLDYIKTLQETVVLILQDEKD